LCGEIVDLVRLKIADDVREGRLVEQIGGDELDPVDEMADRS